MAERALAVAARQRAAAAVRVGHMLAETPAQGDLGLPVRRRRRDETDDVVVQLRERGAHFVELFLGLAQDFIEAVGQRPDSLPLGERAEVPLAPPVTARAAD